MSALASCSTEEAETTPTSQNTETTTVTETEEEYPLELPEGMDLQGQTFKMRVYDTELSGSSDGDEIAYAQYAARTAAEELLNYTTEFVFSEGWADIDNPANGDKK